MKARKLQFSGAFFDGKSSQKHSVDIELTPQEIILKGLDRGTLLWPYYDLSLSLETSSIFHVKCLGDGDSLKTLIIEDPLFYENLLSIAPGTFSCV